MSRALGEPAERGVMLRRYAAGPVLVFAVLAVAFAGWFAAWSPPATVLVADIGSPGDEAFIDGAFPPESNDRESYRWTSDAAIVTLPVPSHGTYDLDLALATAGNTARLLTATCQDGQHEIPLPAGEVLVDDTLRCSSSDGPIVVTLQASPTRLEQDGRPLGVAVRFIRVSALDQSTVVLFYLRTAIMFAATVTGLWLAVCAMAPRAVARGVSGVAAASLATVSVIAPETMLGFAAGPAGILILISGYATQQIRAGHRTAVAALVALAVASILLAPQPMLGSLLASRWTPGDNTATQLLPWLCVALITFPMLMSGRRASWLAATGTACGLVLLLLPLVARAIAGRWSLTLSVPDWTDRGSPAGAIFMMAVAGAVIVALAASVRSRLRAPLAAALVVALALSMLLPWRIAVMNLNGDEPHYYVTARSIGVDRDLELLNNYRDPHYRAATISPDGNIASTRDERIDRYAAVDASGDEESWYLVPETHQLTFSEPIRPGMYRAGRAAIRATDTLGNKENLPALRAADTLGFALANPCMIKELWIGVPDLGERAVDLSLRDAAGTKLWVDRQTVDSQVASLAIPDALRQCAQDAPMSLTLSSSSGPIVAMLMDTGFGLRLHDGREPGSVSLLGGFPRDVFMEHSGLTRLVITNPTASLRVADIHLLSSTSASVAAARLIIVPGGTGMIDVSTRAASAIIVEPSDSLIIAGFGAMPGASYAVPRLTQHQLLQTGIASQEDTASGVWLTLANVERVPTVVHVNGDSIAICGRCATTVHIPGSDTARILNVHADGGRQIAIAAVEYEERTVALHFDLGLPLLAAIPAKFGGPGATFIVALVSTVLLAAGLVLILRRIGITEPVAISGATATALLAPLSPYAVRLYTEPVAACLLVWALVTLDGIRRRPVLIVPFLALTLALPMIHGRYSLLSVTLIALALALNARYFPRLPTFVVMVFTLGTVTLLLLSDAVVSIEARGIGTYFSSTWSLQTGAGMLIDRGSGLIPFAPWCVLALAAGRRLNPLQASAIILIGVQATLVLLRANGWQTWGAPGRYLLPVVPLVALFAVPGAVRLWRHPVGRFVVVATLSWSVLATVLLHWLPLSGYVSETQYLVNAALVQGIGWNPLAIFPEIRPHTSSAWTGWLTVVALWIMLLVPLAPLLRASLTRTIRRSRTAMNARQASQ